MITAISNIKVIDMIIMRPVKIIITV